MKKLKKSRVKLQDSIEAYAGVCNCTVTCNCASCTPSIDLDSSGSYSITEANCLSIVYSHQYWA